MRHTHHAALLALAGSAASLLLPACASREERIRAKLESLPTPEEVFAERDEDADGRLTLEEFKDGGKRKAEDRFGQADADADGLLTLDELRVYYDEVRSRFGTGGQAE